MVKKIAILGGGMSSLTTAFELTSQPDWQQHYDITLYQMGWRLGGKCATARGPNDRIEEHGIHGFLGCYYNALPLMARCYAALDRPAGAPLARFEDAFKPENFVLMWEYVNGGLRRWPFTAPTNGLRPDDPASLQRMGSLQHSLVSVAEWAEELLDAVDHNPLTAGIAATAQWLAGKAVLRELKQSLQVDVQAVERQLGAVDRVWDWVSSHLLALADQNDTFRRLHITAEFLLALVRGTLRDDVFRRGFDALDDENFSDWLARHGASPLTISSPLALNTVNLSYQYPQGDTARTALMGAGCYLHWTLRSFVYFGSFAWLFEAGTGETVIAPLYEVLRRRGVKFAFFNKVASLELSADKTAVAAIHMDIQATLKAPHVPYEPLIDIKGLPSWPGQPRYEQLNEGEAMKAAAVDLESYWSAWQPVARQRLVAGQDFDQVVWGISLGAVPYLCKELLAHNPAWRRMTDKVTTVQTQTMQLWLKRSTTELGWDIPFKHPTDIVIGATYLNPLDGQVDFSHLLPWESWPADAAPRALWYFSGAMADYEIPPPFTDTGYPARQHARVKAQCIQYLQASIGPLLPKATTNVVSPPGDPVGLDFSLLQGYDAAAPGLLGVQQFDQQFWRANIDPTERYVTSPPGSTAARLQAWGSGYANLAITGDWIYTGLNVGSVEGAVMGGRLASHAVSGFPALADIVGFPAQQGPTQLGGGVSA